MHLTYNIDKGASHNPTKIMGCIVEYVELLMSTNVANQNLFCVVFKLVIVVIPISISMMLNTLLNALIAATYRASDHVKSRLMCNNSFNN